MKNSNSHKAHSISQNELADIFKDESLLYDVVVQGSDGFWSWNREVNSLKLSSSFKKLLGFTPNELESDLSLWNAQIVEEEFDPAKASSGEVTLRFRKSDGEIIWLRNRIVRIETGCFSQCINVTELEEEKERLNLAAKSCEIGVWDWYIKKNELIWDEIMYKLYGITEAEFSGAYEAWVNGLHPDDKEISDSHIQMALKGEIEFNTEFRVVWPSDEIRTIKGIGKIFRDESGEPYRMVGVNWDITHEKILLKTIEEKSLELEKKNKELEEFAYVASHDIQAPIRHITGHLSLIKDSIFDDLDLEDKESFEFVLRGAERIKKLVNDLFRLSTIGQDAIRKEFVELEILINEAKEALRQLVEENRVTIISDNLPKIFVDHNLMSLVFQNLINNSIKFKREDIDPIIEVSCDESDKAWLLAVTDNGRGISAENISDIFAIFNRGNKDVEGSGIGLALCRKVVERHGGRLWVESEEGSKTIFYISIPKESSDE